MIDLTVSGWVFWLFWSSLALVVYTWFGYPAILFLMERFLYRPVRRDAIEPAVSVLILAHNEEDGIARKIENVLALDYPRDKLEVVVASDGSFDGTEAVVRSFADQGVSLRAFATRRGKPTVLNEVVPELTGEIVLLLDTRQRLELQTLRALVRNFADPEVGGVSGELMFEAPDRSGFAVGMDQYWRYEKWLRVKEAGIDSTIGGTGAVFALRRDLFQPIPGEAILDDVVLPLQIVRQGKRVILESEARAWDVLQSDWQKEFSRKARTLSGNFQILFDLVRMGPGLRLFGPIGFAYFSHKVARLLGPFCLILLLITNRDLISLSPPNSGEHMLYGVLYGCQLGFYALALLGAFLHGTQVRVPGISLFYSFVIMQAAVLTGFLRYSSGRDDVLWEKAHALDPLSGRQRMIRLILDSTLFTLGFLIAYYLRYFGAPPQAALQSYMQLFPYYDIAGLRLAVPLVMLIPMAVFYFFRVNETRTQDLTPEYFLTLINGIFFSTLLLFFLIYVKRSSMLMPEHSAEGIEVVSFPTSVLLIGFLLNCVLIGGWRMAILLLRDAARQQQQTASEYLLIGAPEEDPAKQVISVAHTPPARILTGKEIKGNMRLRVGLWVEEIRPDGVLIQPVALKRQELLDAVAVTDERRLPVRMLPGVLEILLGRTQPRLTCYIPLLDLGAGFESELYGFGKILANRLGGLLLFVLGTPFLCSLLLASRLAGGRDQAARIVWIERLGTRGDSFWLPRLRFTHGWPRVWVRLARWCLTGYSLLSGRLALVGPRPLPPHLQTDLRPMHRRFLRLRPGVFYLPRIPIDLEGELLSPRLASAIYYNRSAGPALDLQILLRALRESMRRNSARFAPPTQA